MYAVKPSAVLLTLAALALAAATPAHAFKHPGNAAHAAQQARVPTPQYHLHDVPQNTQKPDKHAHVLFETQPSSHAKTEAWQIKEHFAYDKKHHIVQTN